jgi:uncharacterized protein
MEISGIYGFLSLAVASLWMNQNINRNKWITLVLLMVSFFFGVFFRRVEFYTFGVAVILFLISFKYHKALRLKFIWGLTFIILSGLLMFHVLPGFHNYNVVYNLQIEQGAVPYSLYLNFDKALVGISFLFFFPFLISNCGEVKRTLLFSVKYGILVLSIVLLLSYLLGYVKFSVKAPWFSGYFLMANLFFTCLPEEIIFRGIIQTLFNGLFIKFKGGNLWAIAITSVLFGAMHFPGGYKYILLAAVAGFGYGWAYEKTGKIESAVLIHFMLNVFHFFFFTYPALAGAF